MTSTATEEKKAPALDFTALVLSLGSSAIVHLGEAPDPTTGQKRDQADFSLAQVVSGPYSSELWTRETTVTATYASEGWALTDGKLGFLLTKYSQEGMEWSLLDRVPLESGRVGLRWGGCGSYRGDPEHGAWLAPGQSTALA